jgi:hypothetical protein
MKISTKKRRSLGLPSPHGFITKGMRETEIVYKLHSMADKNYLQNVGLVASLGEGQRRKVDGMIACLVALALIFT